MVKHQLSNMVRGNSMRAVAIESFGEPDVLTIADLPIPAPGPGQVRVRVQAAPVHPADIATRAGALAAFLPELPRYTLGWDFAGVVDEVGPDVTGLAAGDPVIGLSDWFVTLTGTQSEYVVLGAGALTRAPSGATPAEASTIGLNALTAWQALGLLGLPSGATLVVVGAAGGVGGFLTELAVARGLHVLAVASAGDEEFVTSLGARFVVRAGHLAEAVPPGGADGVFDTALIGAPALAAVRDGGVYVNLFGPAAPAAERGIRVDSVSVQSDSAQLAELVALADAGKLTLRVAETYPLEQIARAHERFAKGGVRGHLVVEL